MTMKQIASILIMVCMIYHSPAQKHKVDHYSLAFTTMHTDFPFSSFSDLFIKEYHPGFELGTGFNWKNKTRHDWFQTFEFGYSYHRWVQHSIVLYTEFGYRYKFQKGFSANAKIGAGYLHAIPVGKIFKLQEDGYYKKKTNPGHPQAMASFSLGLDKKISGSGMAVFLNYQQRLQFPFIKSYVPLLPSDYLMIGITIPIKRK
jgi:hypothetical protein